MISVQHTAPLETLTTGHQTLTHQAPLLQVLTLQHSVVGARCVADHPVCSTVGTPVIVIDELVSVHMLVHQSLIAQVSGAHIHSHQPPVDTGQIISQTTLDQDNLVNVAEERWCDPTYTIQYLAALVSSGVVPALQPQSGVSTPPSSPGEHLPGIPSILDPLRTPLTSHCSPPQVHALHTSAGGAGAVTKHPVAALTVVPVIVVEPDQS